MMCVCVRVRVRVFVCVGVGVGVTFSQTIKNIDWQYIEIVCHKCM